MKIKPSLWSQEVIQLFFIAMESTWIMMGLLVMDRMVKTNDGPGLMLLCLLYVPVYGVVRAGVLLSCSPGKQRILKTLVLGASLATVVLTYFFQKNWIWTIQRANFKFEAFVVQLEPKIALFTAVIVSTSAIVIRGYILSTRHIDPKGFRKGFQHGLISLGVLLLISKPAGISNDIWISAITSFFFFSLVGSGLSQRLERDDDQGSGQYAQTAITLSLFIGLIICTGFTVYLIVDREFINYLALPLLFLWHLLEQGLSYLSNLLPDLDNSGTIQHKGTLPSIQQEPVEALFDLHWLKVLGHIMFVFGYSSLIIGLMFRVFEGILHFIRKRINSPSMITVNHLEYGFRNDIAVVVKCIAGLIITLWRIVSCRYLHCAPGNQIHRIYAEFLQWGGEKIQPIKLGQTPCEYAAAISPVMKPEAAVELKTMTDIFLMSRFGRLEADNNTFRKIKHCWHEVKNGIK